MFEKQLQWTCRPFGRFWVAECAGCGDCQKKVKSEYIRSEIVDDFKIDFYICKAGLMYKYMIIARFNESDQGSLWIHSIAEGVNGSFVEGKVPSIEQVMRKVQKEYYGLL